MKQHLSLIDTFTTPSKFMISHFLKWGIEAEKIIQVTNGQRDYSVGTCTSSVREKRNRFGFFGQMVDAKGVHIILRAVRQLRSEGFTDFVIELNGDNLRYATEPVRNEIEQFLNEEESKPVFTRNVFSNGPYQVDQLGSRMAHVDWCIVPSIWWEIFGLVISEALMFKRPLIVSNVGGPAERIRDGVDGLHFEIGDPNALAQTLRRACTENGLWNHIVANMVEPPSRQLMVDGFLNIYQTSNGSHLASDVKRASVLDPVLAV